MVERTNQAKLRSEEQSKKAESCRENLWNKIQLKGPQTEIDQEQNKKEWEGSVGLCL